MTIQLTDNRLMVNGERNDDTIDTFEVKVNEARSDFMLEIELIPTLETMENGAPGDTLTVDLLNETVPDVLRENGYHIAQSITNMEKIRRVFEAAGYEIGCYTKAIDEIKSPDQVRHIISKALEHEYTDARIVLNGAKYVVEIATVDNEKDLKLITAKQYEAQYGRAWEEIE